MAQSLSCISVTENSFNVAGVQTPVETSRFQNASKSCTLDIDSTTLGQFAVGAVISVSWSVTSGTAQADTATSFPSDASQPDASNDPSLTLPP